MHGEGKVGRLQPYSSCTLLGWLWAYAVQVYVLNFQQMQQQLLCLMKRFFIPQNHMPPEKALLYYFQMEGTGTSNRQHCARLLIQKLPRSVLVPQAHIVYIVLKLVGVTSFHIMKQPGASRDLLTRCLLRRSAGFKLKLKVPLSLLKLLL